MKSFHFQHATSLLWLIPAATNRVCRAWLKPRARSHSPSPLHRHRLGGCAPLQPAAKLVTNRGRSWPVSALSVSGTTTDDDATRPLPPVPFRDESSFVLAGELPPCGSASFAEGGATSSPPPLRQSPSSSHPLLSPPRPIPDPYSWMRDDSRTNATVLDHLHAENEYGQRVTSHLEELRGELYQEFLSSIQETDYTTPALRTSPEGPNYWYYARFEKGESYPRYCRAPASSDDLYPPPVSRGWDHEVTDSNNATSFPPLLPGEEVYVDVPALARNKTYLAMGAIAISPNQKYVAYSVDEKGGETCQLYVKDIKSREVWVLHDHNSDKNNTDVDEGPDLLECDGSVVWNDESTALYYVTLDDFHRPYRLYRRQIFDSSGKWIGAESREKEDDLLLEEKDELFNLRISKTFDGEFLIVRCSSKESSEVHYLDLRINEDGQDMTQNQDGPALNELTCIAKRQPKVLYRVVSCWRHWLVQTNIGGLPNLSLKACRVGEQGMDKWKDITINDNGVPISVFDGGHGRSLDGITVFIPAAVNCDSHPLLAYAVVTGREDGMPRLWILELNEGGTNSFDEVSSLVASRITRLEFQEDAYDVGIGGNRDHTLPYVVISYDSLVTPPSHIAVPLSSPSELEERRVLKEKEVPGYDKESYACERTTVRSRDGKTDIPVSLVYHRDLLQERNSGATIPTHLYGYGSYGASLEASFRATRLPLLKRKVLYALAHVRGGGEMGRPWYDEGKYLNKKNTFNDFVDVARWLVGEEDGLTKNDEAVTCIGKGITTPNKLSCEGRSAGGLLIGASLNQHPELFRVAILGVPFVDVACTMIDATIPLTVAEWEEWGNPNEERYFDYMISYSPINNIKHGAVYPACLITGGLHDPRVQYWEPAKFAAELRHTASDESGPVILKMDMDSGHFSGSDRYKYLRELAFEYALLLDALDA